MSVWIDLTWVGAALSLVWVTVRTMKQRKVKGKGIKAALYASTLLVIVMACTSTTNEDLQEETAPLHSDRPYTEKIERMAEKYPNFSYSYIPTDSGRIKTIKGNFKVAVDEVDDLDDRSKYIKYLEEEYNGRMQQRDLSNQNVSRPARPTKTYPALFELLDANTIRPAEAKDRNIGGTVFVEFILNEKGRIETIRATESIYFTTDYKLQQAFDKKAIAAVQATDGHWIPARDSAGNAVPMKMELPVTFPDN